jgi:hypothetical protein
MMAVLVDGREQADHRDGRLRWSYWILVTLTVTLFVLGLVLLVSPLWAPGLLPDSAPTIFRWIAILFPTTLGIADLLGLYLYNPIRRINGLMGDITELVVILNSYHIRIALRLVESERKDRPSIGRAHEPYTLIDPKAFCSRGAEPGDWREQERAGSEQGGEFLNEIDIVSERQNMYQSRSTCTYYAIAILLPAFLLASILLLLQSSKHALAVDIPVTAPCSLTDAILAANTDSAEGVVNKQLYPSDLTDSQWHIIQELIPPAKCGGRPRSLEMRQVISAILYITVGGIQWRMLPKDYPKW